MVYSVNFTGDNAVLQCAAEHICICFSTCMHMCLPVCYLPSAESPIIAADLTCAHGGLKSDTQQSPITL